MHSTAQHSTAQHSTIGQLSKRLVQVTAFTLSCLVILPSFTQTANAGTSCLPVGCNFPDDPWDWPDTPPWPGEGGCDQIGCDSEDDDGGSSDSGPPSCSASDILRLRQAKANTPGCTGRPGPTFNTALWRENEGLTIWEWLNAPITLLHYGIWEYADFALDVLALTLISNNSDMNAAYSNFSRALYDECLDHYPNDMADKGFNHCMRNAYFLLENYPTNSNLTAVFLNWALGTSLNVTDYASSWAGKFTSDVTNYQICKDVYSEWDDNDCSGSL